MEWPGIVNSKRQDQAFALSIEIARIVHESSFRLAEVANLIPRPEFAS